MSKTFKHIALTGAHSTGKTTLINKLRSHNDVDWEYVPSVTREIKKKYGVTINEAGDDITQLLMVGGDLHNSMIYDKKSIIMDRCIIDTLVYTQWMYLKGQVTSDTLVHAEHIFGLLISKLDHIFYTDPADIEIEDDGVRSTDKKFRDEIIDLFEVIIKRKEIAGKLTILTGSVENRFNTFNKTINK